MTSCRKRKVRLQMLMNTALRRRQQPIATQVASAKKSKRVSLSKTLRPMALCISLTRPQMVSLARRRQIMFLSLLHKSSSWIMLRSRCPRLRRRRLRRLSLMTPTSGPILRPGRLFPHLNPLPFPVAALAPLLPLLVPCLDFQGPCAVIALRGRPSQRRPRTHPKSILPNRLGPSRLHPSRLHPNRLRRNRRIRNTGWLC